jgi:hypothetical protein
MSERGLAVAPDALGVPETNRSSERVSNWIGYRTVAHRPEAGVQPLVARALVAES